MLFKTKLVLFSTDTKTHLKKILFNPATNLLPEVPSIAHKTIREQTLQYTSEILKVHKDWLKLFEEGFLEELDSTIYLIYSCSIPAGEEIEVKGFEWMNFNDICDLRPLPTLEFEIITRCLNNSDTYFEEFYNGREQYSKPGRRKGSK